MSITSRILFKEADILKSFIYEFLFHLANNNNRHDLITEGNELIFIYT